MDLLRLVRTAAAGSLLVLLLVLPAAAVAPEYRVKAAILYKFALFVEWPAKAFPAQTSPFVACVLGKDPFGPWLQQEMGEARVGAHPVEIRNFEQGKAAEGCHLVFIGASEKSRLEEILIPLRGTSALIVSDVSDIDQFCRWGGMISLLMEGAKVRFKLNEKALEQAGLKIDSKLKRVAISVDCGEAK